MMGTQVIHITILDVAYIYTHAVDDMCTQFFDQAIAPHMVAINENSKGM